MEKHAKKLMKSAKSNFSKAKRSLTCRSLKDLIRAYRACTTASEERALVKKESAHIRDLFREGDKAFRRQNIAKLLFFHMNGYPTSFGMTECIKLCASPKYADKRVAYLGLMILVDETVDILMLMTNCLKQDLLCSDPHIISLALTVLADIASAEMVRDLLPEIELHMQAPNPYIRKKAALAAVRACRKLQVEETEDIVSKIPIMLETSSPAVLVSTAALVVQAAKSNPALVPAYRNALFPLLVNILRDLLLAGGQTARFTDTTISGVRNPFVQVKVLHALRVLIPGAPQETVETLSDLIAQVASNTDNTRTVGCAVLYECVRTILAMDTDPQMQSLAVVTLGKFLEHKGATVRYVALQELVKVCARDKSDGSSVAQFRGTILKCLKESDPTVSQRAVELVYGITNGDNVREMASELLQYLETCDLPYHVQDTCYKLCDITDQFGSSVQFKVDTFISALEKVDVNMPEDLITSFVAMISDDSRAQVHATRALFNIALDSRGAASADVDPFEMSQVTVESVSQEKAEPSNNSTKKRKPRLERLALYVLGEFGDLIMKGNEQIPAGKVVDAIDNILKKSPVIEESWVDVASGEHLAEVRLVREAALGALVKLAARVEDPSGTAASDTSALALVPGTGNDSRALAIVPPATAKPTEVTGLGGDLLASLGIAEGSASSQQSASSALVPQSSDFAMGDAIDDGPLGNDAGGSGSLLLRIRSILATYRKSKDLETQQRACEYSSLLTAELSDIRSTVLSRMPPIDYKTIQEKAAKYRAAQSVGGGPGGQNTFSDKLLSLLDDDDTEQSKRNSARESSAQAPGSELLSLPSSAPSGNGLLALPSTTTQSAPISLDSLLADVQSGNQQASQTNEDLPSQAAESMEAEDSTSVSDFCGRSPSLAVSKPLVISGEFFKDDPTNNPAVTRVELLFTNEGSFPMTQFVFQLAVPKYMQLKMQPASSSDIPPGGSATQRVILSNNMHGTKPVQMRYRFAYKNASTGEITQDQGMAADLPKEL